jgi:hypothetical protein
MARKALDPKDRKNAPTGLRPARAKKRWEHVDRLGDWDDVIPSKPETTVLRDDERGKATKLDRDTKIRAGKLERRERADAGGPLVPGGGRGRSERP